MEKQVRKIDGKKVAINVFIVLLLLIGALVFGYTCYLIDKLSAPIKDYQELIGRMYGHLDDDYYVLLEKDAVTISVGDVDTEYRDFSFSDNILTIEWNETVYVDGEEMKEEKALTFVFLKDERFFATKDGRYLDLMWETVYE